MRGGHCAYEPGGLASAVVAAPLEALASGQAGGNGVYAYGASSSFPSSNGAANYWVDVLFSTTAPPGPLSVGITWASIANVYLELGATSVLIDGYITRLPGSDFYGGGGGLAYTHTNYSSDQTAICAVLAALGGPPHIHWLF